MPLHVYVGEEVDEQKDDREIQDDADRPGNDVGRDRRHRPRLDAEYGQQPGVDVGGEHGRRCTHKDEDHEEKQGAEVDELTQEGAAVLADEAEHRTHAVLAGAHPAHGREQQAAGGDEAGPGERGRYSGEGALRDDPAVSGIDQPGDLRVDEADECGTGGVVARLEEAEGAESHPHSREDGEQGTVGHSPGQQGAAVVDVVLPDAPGQGALPACCGGLPPGCAVC